MKKYYAVWIVLLLCSIGIVAGAPLSQAVSKEHAAKAEGIFVTRPFETPLTLQEIEHMKNTVLANFNQKFGKPAHPVGFAVPQIPEGAFIAAFGFKIYPNGMTMQYVGVAGNEQSVPIIHGKAENWNGRTETYQGDGIGILGATWVTVALGEGDYYLDPYGGVTNNWELRWLSNDGSSTRDWFAVKHIFAMEPGYQAYSSSWKNHRGYPTTDWSVSTYGNPQLHEWDPLGTTEGSQTVSVSISGGTSGSSATWGWSYTQPAVTTYDRSSTGTEKASWEMQFNGSGSQTSTGGMKPGSSCAMNQPGLGTYTLVHLESKGTFKKAVWWWYEYMTLIHGCTIYLTYS